MKVLTRERRWTVTPPTSPHIQEGKTDAKIGREKDGGHCLGHAKLCTEIKHVASTPSSLHRDIKVHRVLSPITTSF